MSYPEPRYLGVKGEHSATFRPARLPPDLTIGQQTAMRYLATGASTHGQFGLYRWDAEPHTAGPSAHFHRTMSESFSFCPARCGCSMEHNGLMPKPAIFCMCRKEASTASITNPTSRDPCCSCSHPARPVKAILKPSLTKPLGVGSAMRSGMKCAGAMTIFSSNGAETILA